MITATNLTKKYGRFRAVDDLSFHVKPGEAVALWGSNGAGKTTAIRCVLNLVPYRGVIEVAGMNIRKHGKAARRLIGYVPQELAFHDDLRLMETLHLFARLRRVGADRPAAVLEEVGLTPHARKRIRELSGGMKQRLALALALLSAPPLLVLDELTSNLDTAAQNGFMHLLRQQKAAGRTILFTSHRLEEVESLADRVVVLESGRQRLECPPDELAGALGLRMLMQVFVAQERLDEAVRALKDSGYAAERNGISLSVEVPPDEKAAPIRVLTEAAINVRNFDFIGENGNGGRNGH
jgi:ABC-type multidrug transport system ATPase subunit